MRVLLLAAGLGTRLRQLTDSVPKCLVLIKGQPLLEIWLERLTSVGFGPFLINTHYLSDQVETFVEGCACRDQISLVHESELRGTAGTLNANLDFFQGEDGLLIHADNYCLADLRAFQQAHLSRPSECLVTMMTFRTEVPSSCGIVGLDERGVVVSFHEKVPNPPSNLANGAVYILSREFFDIMKSKLSAAEDFSTQVLSQLVGRIYSYETKEMFLDIGTPESYKQANQ